MYSVAIMGATGAVGRELLTLLEERNFPLDSLRLLASSRSAGTKLPFRGEELTVELLTKDSFEGIDVVLSSAGGAISKEYVPAAVEARAVVIDNTSAFRMDPDVPLVVPEVNAPALRRHKGIIANPNCSTIQMVVALNPLHRAARILRLIVSTYQAASGAGAAAMDELIAHSKASLAGEQSPSPVKFPHSLAFNCIPHVDVFLENGYTREEMKMVHETRKIMSAPEMRITATTVRVPALRSHSESINIETEKHLSAAEARELLRNAPGVEVLDDPSGNIYPMPATAAGRDPVYVGRIREDESIENGLNLWVVADQIRKGAALNSLQIAETMIEQGLLEPKAARSRA